MKLLILSSTVFLGRHIVEAALARGHEITLFNRGQRNPELFPEVEKLRGDRDGKLEALRGRRWEAVHLRLRAAHRKSIGRAARRRC